MKFRLLFSILLSVFFAAPFYGAPPVKLGDGPSGSVYSYSMTFGPGTYGRRIYLWDNTANAVHTEFERWDSTPEAPQGTNYTKEGTFTVPLGGNYTFWVEYRAVDVNNGQWNTENTYVTSTAGTWQPAPNCPEVAYDYWIDNRTGQRPRQVRVALVDVTQPSGQQVTVVPGTLSIVSPGAMLHLAGNFVVCSGSLRLQELESTGDGEQWFLASSDEAIGNVELAPTVPDVGEPAEVTDSPDVAPDTTTTPTAATPKEVNSEKQLGVLNKIETNTALSGQNTSKQVKLHQYTNERLKSIDDRVGKLANASDATKPLREAELAALAKNKDESAVVGNAETKQGEAEDLIESLEGLGDSGSAPGGPGSAPSMFVLEIGEYVFDLDPSSNSIVSTGAAWIKSVIMWLILVSYVWWVVHELEEMIKTMALTPQARGNPVVGGTGAQFTAFTCAVAITVAIFAAVPAIWALAALPSIDMTNVVSGGATVISSGSGVVQGAIYLLWFFFPVQYLLTIMIHMFAFKKSALVICMGVLVFIKNFTL